MNKFAGRQVQVAALIKYFRHLMNVCPYLIEPIVSVKLGSFLEQAFYPGGERGKSVNVEASINRVVTETGAELSIIRYALD